MRYSHAKSGFAVEVSDQKSATLGACADFTTYLNGPFSIVFHAKFETPGQNFFLSGLGGGNAILNIARNSDDLNDDSITFNTLDEDSHEISVKWAGIVADHDWNNFIFSCTAPLEDGGIKLFLDNVEATIFSETHDQDFSIQEALTIKLGETGAAGVNTNITAIYFYDRVLTATERARIQKGVYPTDYLKAFPFHFPHRGLNEALPTWVNV